VSDDAKESIAKVISKFPYMKRTKKENLFLFLKIF